MRTERAESRVCNKYALRQHCVDSAIYCTVCIIICRCTLHDHRYILHIPVLSENSSTFLKRFYFFSEEILKTRVGFANQGLAVWVARCMGTSVRIRILPTPLLQRTLHWISRLVAVPWSLVLVWSWLGELNWRILISYTSKSRNVNDSLGEWHCYPFGFVEGACLQIGGVGLEGLSLSISVTSFKGNLTVDQTCDCGQETHILLIIWYCRKSMVAF